MDEKMEENMGTIVGIKFSMNCDYDDNEMMTIMMTMMVVMMAIMKMMTLPLN